MTAREPSSQSRFGGLTISRKILFITGFTSFVTLSLLSAFILVRESRAEVDRRFDQLETIAGIVSSNAVGALRFDDGEAGGRFLESLQHESSVTAAVLFDREGGIFATFLRERGAVPPLPDRPGPFRREASLGYSAPIELSGERLGTIVIETSERELWLNFLDSVVVVLVLLLGGVTLSLLFTLALKRSITEPLDELAGLAQRVSRERDYHLRARKRYDDEIGSLVDSVNFMLGSVQERDQALEENREELERQVAARTIDLREAMEEAQAASRAKSLFLANMSHELRTPMNAIVGMTSLLRDSGLDEERRGFIDIIRQSSETLLGLISNVLDYSKIESGRMELEDLPFCLTDSLEGAMELVAAQGSRTSLLLVTSIDPELPRYIQGDDTRLRQVLVNLLSNAVKFTERGHVQLKARRIAGEGGEPAVLEILVEDTGIGIPADRQHRLFESFSQVDASTTRRFGGTGLGLAISQRLAEAMGGEIRLKSQAGKGSTFWFRLPLRPVEAAGAGGFERFLQRMSEARPRVAFFEVPEPLLGSLRTQLESWGCRITALDQAEVVFVDAVAESAEEIREQITAMQKVCPMERVAFICWAAHMPAMRAWHSGPILSMPVQTRRLRQLFESFPALNRATSAPIPLDERASGIASLRVLVAEDNLVNQRVFALMMHRLGLTVDIAHNGEEAVSKVRAQPYDVVFMDLQMPKMDGLEATRHIRSAEGGDVPWIVGFTANVESDAAPAMRHAGMNDYLLKPVRFDEVRRVLDSYIDQRPAWTGRVKDEG